LSPTVPFAGGSSQNTSLVGGKTFSEPKKLTPFQKKINSEKWSKKNIDRLNKCPKPHNFSIPIDTTTGDPSDPNLVKDKFVTRWQCSVCNGQVWGRIKMWYERGFQDALKLLSKEAKIAA
jgi:hypothetical protein